MTDLKHPKQKLGGIRPQGELPRSASLPAQAGALHSATDVRKFRDFASVVAVSCCAGFGMSVSGLGLDGGGMAWGGSEGV